MRFFLNIIFKTVTTISQEEMLQMTLNLEKIFNTFLDPISQEKLFETIIHKIAVQ